MGITSARLTQYYTRCDVCGVEDVVADNRMERVYSKQQAIKWAGMHKIKDGRILCNECYLKYKTSKEVE